MKQNFNSNPQSQPKIRFDSHLLAGKDEPLLLRWDAFLLLHPLLDSVHFVRGLNVDLDFLSGQGLREDTAQNQFNSTGTGCTSNLPSL